MTLFFLLFFVNLNMCLCQQSSCSIFSVPGSFVCFSLTLSVSPSQGYYSFYSDNMFEFNLNVYLV